MESYYPTIENTFSHEITYKNQTYLTEIIDTAGQVRSVAGMGVPQVLQWF